MPKYRMVWVLMAVMLTCACLTTVGVIALIRVAPWPPGAPRATVVAAPSPTAARPQASLPQALLDQNQAAIVAAPRPDRDLLALLDRLKPDSAPAPAALPESRTHQVGAAEQFWVGDQDRNEHFVVTATLRFVSEHGYFYVDNTLSYDENSLKQAAETFSSKTFPTDIRIFGDYWRPGLDGDSRVTILNTLTPGAGGYFSSADEYTLQVNRYSNQRRMIYVDTKSYPIGTPRYDAVLAHELQHAIHWMVDPGEDSWVNEGLSELAARVNGFPVGRAYAAFAAAPNTQLDDWSDQSSDNTVHYGASYAFMTYFLQRFGEPAIRELVADPAHGLDGFIRVLQHQSPPTTFDSLFRDWVLANYLNDPAVAEGRYSYGNLDLRVTRQQTLNPGAAPIRGQVAQYAAAYHEIRPAPTEPTLFFTGTRQVDLIGAAPHSGSYFWWGNRGDSMDSRLTEQLDLTGLTQATVSYWTWYDIEENWDYAYVEVSTDNGNHWSTLRTGRTTDLDPEGQNYGNGYTGKSAGWTQEQVDLSAYAGNKVLLRFEYVTDDAVNNPGIGLDDICLVETGKCDDAESPGPWLPEGFVRVAASLPQRYAVQIIEFGRQIRVVQLPLDADNRGQMVLPFASSQLTKAVVVVSGLTPITTVPASFQLAVSP